MDKLKHNGSSPTKDQSQKPWYLCSISGGGGEPVVYNDISFRAILFSFFWGPGAVGGADQPMANSWFDGPVLWDSKGAQQ